MVSFHAAVQLILGLEFEQADFAGQQNPNFRLCHLRFRYRLGSLRHQLVVWFVVYLVDVSAEHICRDDT